MKPDLHPIVGEQTLSFDELEVLVREGKVPEEQLSQFQEKYNELEARLHDVFKANRDVVIKLEEALRQQMQRAIPHKPGAGLYRARCSTE